VSGVAFAARERGQQNLERAMAKVHGYECTTTLAGVECVATMTAGQVTMQLRSEDAESLSPLLLETERLIIDVNRKCFTLPVKMSRFGEPSFTYNGTKHYKMEVEADGLMFTAWGPRVMTKRAMNGTLVMTPERATVTLRRLEVEVTVEMRADAQAFELVSFAIDAEKRAEATSRHAKEVGALRG